MEKITSTPIRLGFTWTVATTIGYLLGFITMMAVIPLANAVGELITFTYGINYLVFHGIGIGVAQAIVLKKYFPMKWWILASTIGWVLVILFTRVAVWLLVDIELYAVWLAMIEAGLIGLVVGFFQSLLIRKVYVRAYWWILANLLGWGISSILLVVNYLRNEMMNNFIYSGVFTFIVLSWLPGFVVGLITAIGLIWIMIGPKRVEPDMQTKMASAEAV